MIILRIIALPFLPIYWFVVWLRNLLYDKRIMRSSEFDIPLISIGNLSVGGTGKTPHTEYIAKLLAEPYHPAILSRGYGRRDDGFRIIQEDDSYTSTGDEPLQMKRKLGDKVVSAVNGNRVKGVILTLYEHEEVDVVLLDDAFQHRAITPGYSILLTTWKRPFWKDFPLPLGDLREFRFGAKRADMVVVTKCPDGLTADQKEATKERIRRHTNAPVFFSSYAYGSLRTVADHTPVDVPLEKLKNVVLVTGIANAENLKAYIASKTQLVEHLEYRDHYRFKARDIQRVRKIFDNFAKGKIALITTEKDAIRLRETPEFETLPDACYFIPIEVKFGDDKTGFDKEVIDYVGKHQGNHLLS